MAISAVGSETAIRDAITRASARRGVGFDYLMAAAQRESGFDCHAKSKTSSACGLYQFVSQTWLSTLKAYGATEGLESYAKDITRTGSGQYVVNDPARQAEILALREDPAIAAAMAAALTADNAKVLSERLGRPPTEGELYAAHVLGASGAAKLITSAMQDPAASAVSLFPEAASSNRGLFYDKEGAAVSVSALAARLTSETAASAPRTVPLAHTPSPPGALRPTLDFSGASQSSNYPDARSAETATGNTVPGLTRWHGGSGGTSLTLTPQVLQILSALELPIDSKEEKREKQA